MARVLGRIRLSRVTDATTSPERQRETIQKGADQRGDTVAAWVYDGDYSRSESPFDAPELAPWLSDPVKRSRWDVLVAARCDRLGAGWKLSGLFQWVIENGKDLLSEDVGFSLRSQFGQTIYTLYADLAMNEWKAIQSRNLNSHSKLRTIGRWHGGAPPYWLMPAPKGAGWTLVLDEYPAAITRRIVHEYLSQRPILRICTELNDDGVLAPVDYRRFRSMALAEAQGREYRGRPIGGIAWRYATVVDILKNKSLMGHAVHQDETVYDEEGSPVVAGEALVTPAEFEKIQAETARRKANSVPRREAGASALLAVAVCVSCGHRLYLSVQANRKGTRYRYYRFPCRHFGMLLADDLEDAVHTAFVQAVGQYPRLTPKFIEAENHTVELEQAERAYAVLSEQLAGSKSDRARKALTERMMALEGRMAALEAMPETAARVEYQTTGESYAEAWARMGSEERRSLMLDTGVQARTKKTDAGEPLVTLTFRSGFLARLGVAGADPEDGWEMATGNVPQSMQ